MSTLSEALQIEPFSVCTDKEPYTVTTRMALHEFHAQPIGFVHGGALLAAAETVAGMASIAILPPESFPVGQFVAANHMHSKVSKGYMKITAELLHRGRGSHVWCVRFWDEETKPGTSILISQISMTNAIVRRHKET